MNSRIIQFGLLTVFVLSGCQNLPAPAAPDAYYYCKPDSAVRYRGKVPEGVASIRPAPAHGSCRHQ